MKASLRAVTQPQHAFKYGVSYEVSLLDDSTAGQGWTLRALLPFLKPLFPLVFGNFVEARLRHFIALPSSAAQLWEPQFEHTTDLISEGENSIDAWPNHKRDGRCSVASSAMLPEKGSGQNQDNSQVAHTCVLPRVLVVAFGSLFLWRQGQDTCSFPPTSAEL